MSQPVIQRHPTNPTDIDHNRLLTRIRELGLIGLNLASSGITREGFSPADLRAREYLMREARGAGLVSQVDAAGNILIRMASADHGAERRPVLLIGSHLDTVVDGGRLDGAYGVLAALEVLQVCAESSLRTHCELVAVTFANEEGALFPQPFFGSMVLAGRIAELPAEPMSHQNRHLREPLASAGGDLDNLGSACWSPGSIAAYLELHIEQGPTLERGGQAIGVVDAITGRCVLTVEISGTAGHAGTTPMDLRHDPVAAASRVVLAAEALSRDRGLCRVSTVGWMDIYPNSPNTIAGRVRLTVDLRDTDPARLANVEDVMRGALRTIADQTGTELDVVSVVRSEPVSTSPDLRAAIEESADELGLDHVPLPSGAGHDAQIIADITQVAMIFVPSINGVSHRPEENTAPADLIAGAQVLLRTALRVTPPRTAD